MRRLIALIFMSILFILNAQAQINYHITGSIEGRKIDKLYLTASGKKIDSAVVMNDKFEMRRSYKGPAVGGLMTVKPNAYWKLILDNGDYAVHITAAPFGAENVVTNAPNHQLWVESVKKVNDIMSSKSMDSLKTAYRQLVENGVYDQSSLFIEKYKALQSVLIDYYKKLATDHPDMYITPYMLRHNVLNMENFGAYFAKLNPEVQANEWGVDLKAMLEKKRPETPDRSIFYYTMLGSKAKTFESQFEDSKPFNLESQKGHWVLLDFWASWCVPCRREVPYLKKAFDQFKDKNFVISSVSLDADKEKWQKAVKEDETTQFIHTNIPNFGKTEAQKYYQVNTIPANFLINPEGRIVAMDLRGDDLITTLTRLIK